MKIENENNGKGTKYLFCHQVTPPHYVRLKETENYHITFYNTLEQ